MPESQESWRGKELITSSVKVLWRSRKRPFLMTMFVLLLRSCVLLVTDPVTLEGRSAQKRRELEDASCPCHSQTQAIPR